MALKTSLGGCRAETRLNANLLVRAKQTRALCGMCETMMLRTSLLSLANGRLTVVVAGRGPEDFVAELSEWQVDGCSCWERAWDATEGWWVEDRGVESVLQCDAVLSLTIVGPLL